MTPFRKSGFVLILLVIAFVPTTSGYQSSSEDGGSLLSDSLNGQWINDTLMISGTTTISPQTATWGLFNITETLGEENILQSGDFFTEVIPIQDGLWSWELSINVSEIECICLVQITQSTMDESEVLNRILFIGEGPHPPVLSPLHDSIVMIDGQATLNAEVMHSIAANESNLLVSWCYSPNGACEGDVYNKQIGLQQNELSKTHELSFSIDVENYSLNDGIWKFEYQLQNPVLEISPTVSFDLYVDHTDPTAEIIAPELASEGDVVLFDGSGSSDGVWGKDLQSVWTIVQPDGIKRVANEDELNGMVLVLHPILSGNYTVNLDVIDSVGRISSTTTTLNVVNIPPLVGIETTFDKSLVTEVILINSGDDLDLSAIALDTFGDDATLQYEWILNGNQISSDKNITFTNLVMGDHKLVLIVTDDNGETGSKEVTLAVKDDSSHRSQDNNIRFLPMLGSLIVILIATLLIFKMKASRSESLPKWETNPELKP